MGTQWEGERRQDQLMWLEASPSKQYNALGAVVQYKINKMSLCDLDHATLVLVFASSAQEAIIGALVSIKNAIRVYRSFTAI